MTSNNESKANKKLMKKDFNKLGITLIMHELILNVIMIAAGIGSVIMQVIKNPNVSEDQVGNIFENTNFTGTMSIIAVMLAFIPILIYRKKKFFQYDLKVRNKKITLKIVIIGFVILSSLNNILGVFANGLECGLNAIGLSASSALNNLKDLDKLTIPMVMYACIIGPVFEEFIYRGAVLRSFEKYGRWFAILISSILFGLMHGNFYQIFMAIGVGIILGYLATEYSIKLSILLHIINNTLVTVLSQITSHFSENVGNNIDNSMAYISAIILIIAFVSHKNNIKEWLQNNRIEKGMLLRYFTSISIILLIAIDFIMVVSDIARI